MASLDCSRPRLPGLALALSLVLSASPGCVLVDLGNGGEEGADETTTNSSSGDGDGEASSGDGDGEASSGDGDGEASSGDGDGDSGDGDGDSGDGDGDPATEGDGDGDPEPSCVGVIPIADEPQGDGDGDMGTTGDGDGDMGTTGDGDGDLGTTGDGDGDLGTTGDGDGDLGTTGEEPCPECAPYWRLYDFQPQSCGYEWTYGMDSFEGHVTLVALLAGWCGFCQAQAQKMEQMRIELQLEGYDVQFIAVNGTSADTEEYRQNLVDRCAFPLFQDTAMQSAWSAHGGGKDDMYIYGADGTLVVELPYGEEVPTNLSTEEGYDAVKQALIDAAG